MNKAEAKLPRGYPDSGAIEGEHWSRFRIKYLLREIDKRTSTGTEPLLSMRQGKGLIPHNDVSNKRFKSEELVGYKIACPGQLVMNRMRASIGLFAASHTEGLVSPDYAVFQPLQPVNLDYLVHLFRTPVMGALFRQESKGMGTGSSGFLRLYTDRFGAISISIPPLEGQNHIVAFVRATEKEIARFIRNKRRLIELLKEQKQNVINQAVTRGLDPKVNFKPSGVEWIGDIPEHWDARRLRTLAAVRASGVDKNTNEAEVPVMLCNYVDVYKNDRITAAIDFMKATATPEEIRAFELKAGDVIITKDSESWDDIAIPTFVPEAIPGVVCAYHLALIRPFSGEIEGEFLFRAFSSDPVADQFRIAATGVTRFGLAQGAIKGAFFPLPPLEEQWAIIAHINEKCAEISQAISRAEREIALMREYRIRLISDVVTGQVDVRGIEVPEVAEEELLALEEDTAESDDVIDDEGDMDETD